MVRAAANREVERNGNVISAAEPGWVSTALLCLTLCPLARLIASNNDPGLFYDTTCHDVILRQKFLDLLQASFCRYLHLCVDPFEYDDHSTQHLIQSHADHTMGAVPMHCLMANHWIF